MESTWNELSDKALKYLEILELTESYETILQDFMSELSENTIFLLPHYKLEDET